MNNLVNTLSLTPVDISLSGLTINIFLAAVFALLLARFYVLYGKSLSNRSKLAGNFLLISVTTALVITIVKSSLALSLGLVGALSIVRFRAAIKDPEELAYLFLAIAIGLGFGAEQRMVTVVALITILSLIFLQQFISKKIHKENLFLTLSLEKKRNKIVMEDVLNCIKQFSSRVDLRRIDDSNHKLKLGLMVEFSSGKELELMLHKLRKKFPNIQTSLIDSSGIIP